MIDINRFIDNISEEQITRYLKDEIIINDFVSFIRFLKKNHSCTQYICSTTEENAKIFLMKIINCFNINDLNIDETYELIKNNASLINTRVSDWNTCEIPLINEISDNIKIKCRFAEFKYVNKWGYETKKSTYKLMYNDKNILWIKNSYEEPQYYILKYEMIYGIKYEHKIITIYKSIDSAFGEFISDKDSDLDIIINKFESKKININVNKIGLSKYFYKGFFYKGILFDRNWKKDITMVKEIGFTDGLLKIDIENLTYPHCGYLLLDIENNKINSFFKSSGGI
jgi:hypothetical protein